MSQEYDPLASVQAAGPPGTISFVYGLPAPETFPAGELSRAAAQVLRERPSLALQYGPEQGYGPLIDYLRCKLEREEGLALERAQVMLTHGSSATLDLLCTMLTRPGDTVLVEAPTYHDALQVLRDHGLTPLQIATDGDGLRVDALEERLAGLARSGNRARLIYTIPSFQNPSGVTLAGRRRAAVLELAERYDLLVVEDDVYRDLAFDAAVPPSLFALDGGRRVLRIGSFSKILAPGLRMGWLIAPPGIIGRLLGSGLLNMGGGANPLVANMLAAYCLGGHLEPHIESLRRVYCERRDAALAALAAEMPPGVSWTRPGGGMFIWIELPPPLRAVEVAARAREAGLRIPPGDGFFAEAPAGQFLRLAYSYVTAGQLRDGIGILARSAL